MAGCVPERVQENKDYPGMTPEEIQKYIDATGVVRRHCAVHDGSICTSDLCFDAIDHSCVYTVNGMVEYEIWNLQYE